jgi:steroid 5-alpha reductase family enzyme
MSQQSEFQPRYTKSFSLLVVFFIYIGAYATGVFAVQLLRPYALHFLTELAIVSLASTLVLFGFSRAFKNSSIYDAYWSIAPLVYINFWLKRSDDGADIFRQIIISISLFLWGLRLTLNWVRSWNGLKFEDWRHSRLKNTKAWKAFFIDLFGLHIFQAFMVYLIALPLYPAMAMNSNSLNIIDMFAFFICLFAIVIETLADEQLRQYKKRFPASKEFFNRGMWGLSRHPNYFGEWLFWFGIFLFAVAAGNNQLWTVVGCVAIWLMFNFVSIPLMEKRLMETRSGYADYKKKVSAFFLNPFRQS